MVKCLNAEFFFVNYASFEDEIEQQEKQQKEIYSMLSISVFDHCLTEEEYVNEPVVFFGDRLDSENSFKIYKRYEEQFLAFYAFLYDNTEVYSIFFDQRGDRLFVEFEKKDVYSSHALLSIREQLSLKLVLSKFHAILDGGNDLTHPLQVKKSNDGKLETLTKIVQQHGLFVLR